MNLYLIFIIVVSLIGIEFCFKNKNKDYLSKTNTSCVKGIFILIVFYSHYVTYTHVNMSKDYLMYDVKIFLGQLMVTLFLFYSGYGIFESIKNKKDYIKKLPKNRILKTLLNFMVAVLMFYILSLFIGPDYPLKTVLLSLIGWSGLGNSNWYIFGIICLYISSYISFSIFHKKKDLWKGIVLNYILTIALIIVLSMYKDSWWYNTLLCYNLGLSYSYHKTLIEKKLFNYKYYFIIVGITLISFIFMMNFKKTCYWYYEIYAMLFCLLVVEATVLINFKSKILKWFGDNLFWVYIMQRLPMILFAKLGLAKYPYKYALVTFVCTIVLAFIFSYFDKFTNKYIFKKNNTAK